MVTRKGMSIRFSEKQLRVASRASGGVRGITLDAGDHVVGMDLVKPDCELLVATERGLGKRTPLDRYRRQSRGGKGLRTIALTERGGEIVGGRVVCSDDKAIILTSNGIAIRLRLNEVRCCARSTMGVKLINLGEGDTVSSLAIVAKAEEQEEE